MTPFAAAVLAQALLAVLACAAAVACTGQHARNVAAGEFTAGLGLAGAVTGALALAGQGGTVAVPAPLPGLTLTLAATPLGGLFTLIAGLVGAVAALYGIGYAHGAAGSRTAWSALAVFLLGLQLVPLAGDVAGFLTAWETMALASTVLVLTEHRARATVRPAAGWYAVMTHLSFLLVAAGLGVLAARAGSWDLAAITAARPGGTAATVAFLLLVLGFGAKAGLVPLHVWLPRAHPEAPSHVSALMSAAMVKMGVYGILLVTTRLLAGGPAWWGLVLLALALPSAVFGILQAAVSSDIKRLLAYSTTENMGLILAAAGIAQVTAATGNHQVARTALVAAVLLTVSHAAFKTALFLAAGAIVHATGERDLDRMGGLARRMPVTTVTLGVGALGAAALPVTSGFVAEWVLLQALIHADARTDRLTTALLPLVIGVVALTTGLALLTFTKAFGIAALARPRSHGADAAREVPWTMRAAMLLAAAAVLGAGLAPGPVAAALGRVPGEGSATASGLLGVRLPGVGASLDTLSLLLLGLALTVPVLAGGVALARRAPAVRTELPWGCGRAHTGPRMQYTATSYAEPLLRVFDDALAPTRDVTVTHAEESRFILRYLSYSHTVADVVETRAYAPLTRALRWLGDAARRVQNGSIHRYLAFSFAALVLVLVGVL